MSDSNRRKMGHFLLVRGMHKLFAASCCDSWGWAKDGRGRNRQRETEGGEKSEKEWTLQSDLKFIFNQASSSQNTMLPWCQKGKTLRKLTSKRDWSHREEKQLYTNKPWNLTVTPENNNFLLTKLCRALKYKSFLFLYQNTYLIEKVMPWCSCSLNMTFFCFLQWQKSHVSFKPRLTHTHRVATTIDLRAVCPWCMSHYRGDQCLIDLRGGRESTDRRASTHTDTHIHEHGYIQTHENEMFEHMWCMQLQSPGTDRRISSKDAYN